ncbi:hypothetical protein L1987_41184 [Smallanthus sonchifolius]|uniref:Uncharacterized protein n=1 Tax=Smallanthus sonchifolius TaxID=185202 RepID=A0ACB9GUA5_9ASTR|nr:hypothetical protein L1987_41184 [Smallanthus sonchifolius]
MGVQPRVIACMRGRIAIKINQINREVGRLNCRSLQKNELKLGLSERRQTLSDQIYLVVHPNELIGYNSEIN